MVKSVEELVQRSLTWMLAIQLLGSILIITALTRCDCLGYRSKRPWTTASAHQSDPIFPASPYLLEDRPNLVLLSKTISAVIAEDPTRSEFGQQNFAINTESFDNWEV